ncbi:MAG TPA: hypothetical protein VM580_00460 [Labilithrix sp.]|nr:hypothetical protein [Labilithrix sp.]
MAKKTKGKQATAKGKRRSSIRRQERRFVSQASTNPTLVRGLGALSALLLGAGLWAFFYAKSFAGDEKLRALPSYAIAAGAMLMGIAIWFGTSSEPPVRVGAPGISLEKGDLRRMPWWCVEKITFESGALAVAITGKDEMGVDWSFKVPVMPHPEAVAWIIKEAQERIPRRVDIAEETLEKLPIAQDHAGQRLDLEPLQVVGKRCSVTGKIISYEPDGRVCPACERVYLKDSVPKKCKCGSSLEHLRPKSLDDAGDSAGEIEDEVASSSRMDVASKVDAEETTES